MRIAIFHGGNLFIKPFVKDWQEKGHDVRMGPCYSRWTTWKPDLLFFEFCTANIVIHTTQYERECPTFCRLHGVGYRFGTYRHVDWKKVDGLIFVSDWLKRACEVHPEVFNTKRYVVNNGVDMDEFTLKRNFEPTYKVAYVGRDMPLKGIDRLPEIIQRFKQIDPRYELHTAMGNVPHENMNEWLEDKDYLIHPSTFETFCMAVAEAMAKGIRPLINNWPGADETWGEEFFLDKFNLQQDPLRLRSIIETKYNLKRTMKEINEIVGL